MARPTTRRLPRLEDLEARTFLSADVTDLQQLTLELINEARTAPTAAAERVEGNMSRWAEDAIAKDGDTVADVLSEIADAGPRPPVALDLSLTEAAESHTEYQIAIGQQTHTGPGGLASPTDRAIAAGYDNPEAVDENIIYGVGSPEQAMRAFLADYGPTNAGDPHRENIQQTNPAKKSVQEVGVAVLPVGPAGAASSSGGGTQYVVTQVFGRKAEAQPTLLGVVYDDADEDRFYDMGEGVGDAKVTITDKATGDSTEVETWSSGGYQARVQPGEYEIDVRLGDRQLGTGRATVGQDNAKVDFRVNLAASSSMQVASPSGATAARPTTTATKVDAAKPVVITTKPEAPTTSPATVTTRAESAPRVIRAESTPRPDATPTPTPKPSPASPTIVSPPKATDPVVVTSRPQTLPAKSPIPAFLPVSATPPKYKATDPSTAAPPARPSSGIDPTSTPSTPPPASEVDDSSDVEGQAEGREDSGQVEGSPRVTKRLESLLRPGTSDDASTTPRPRSASSILRSVRAWALG